MCLLQICKIRHIQSIIIIIELRLEVFHLSLIQGAGISIKHLYSIYALYRHVNYMHIQVPRKFDGYLFFYTTINKSVALKIDKIQITNITNENLHGFPGRHSIHIHLSVKLKYMQDLNT